MIGVHTRQLLARIHEGREQHAQESRVQHARRRHGKPFAIEPGSAFKWQSGPFVLAEWLASRKSPHPGFCRHPAKCAGHGYCPREISCID